MMLKPRIETAPLPAGARFLNVIESIFSGMARAVIHNSDYASLDDTKAAIDGYFAERNRQFHENPRRAGKLIWGKRACTGRLFRQPQLQGPCVAVMPARRSFKRCSSLQGRGSFLGSTRRLMTVADSGSLCKLYPFLTFGNAVFDKQGLGDVIRGRPRGPRGIINNATERPLITSRVV